MMAYLENYMADRIQLILRVPFEQKDAAKALGARWLASEKTWYVPYGIDIQLFKAWWPSDLQQASKSIEASSKSTSRKGVAKPHTATSSQQATKGHVTGPSDIPLEEDSKLPWED